MRPRFMPVANCLFYITRADDVTIAGYVRQLQVMFDRVYYFLYYQQANDVNCI